MRRSEKEITGRHEIDQIIADAEVMRLGLVKDSQPYVIPLNFGYDGAALYFHTAREGMKIDYLLSGNRACFEMEVGVSIKSHESLACKWGASFSSIIGFGYITEIVEHDEKSQALSRIMGQYSQGDWEFPQKAVQAVRVWKLTVDSVTGKRS